MPLVMPLVLPLVRPLVQRCMMARPSMSTHTRSHLQVLHRYMMSSATDGSMEECMVRVSERGAFTLSWPVSAGVSSMPSLCSPHGPRYAHGSIPGESITQTFGPMLYCPPLYRRCMCAVWPSPGSAPRWTSICPPLLTPSLPAAGLMNPRTGPGEWVAG